MATTSSKLATTLPVSPIAPAAGGPAAQAGAVQINLGAETGQVVTGGEFGLATTMGTPNWSYASYADPAFQAVADQYPTDLLRHNWELNTMMDLMFPTRASASKPDFSRIDTFLGQQANLKGFFDNGTGTQIVTLGFPSWLNIGDPADQALYAGMVKGIAQHFIDKGEPIPNYELVNEPDGRLNVTDLAHTFNAVADALHSIDPAYKLGGLSESWYHQDDMQTFLRIAGQNVGFVSWHQYVEGSSGSKSDQQVVNDAMGVQGQAQAVRAQMRAAGIPDEVPLFLGEYNVDGGDYNDPANANMVGAVAAAATTYGMIHSNANFTMGALWDVQNDSAYSVFGHQGSYRINPVGVVLADLTAYMPGNMVRTTMPGDTPGLLGYTTKSGQGFSTALIDTNLLQGYTVDLSKDGLPTAGLYRVEVSAANPKGSRTALTDLSHVSVAAGSVVIVTDEAPHGGTEVNGTTSTVPASASADTPSTDPTPPATSGSTTTAAVAHTSGSGTGGTPVGSATAAQPAASTSTGTAVTAAAAGSGSTSPSGSATQAVAGTSAAGLTAADPAKAAVGTTAAGTDAGQVASGNASPAGTATLPAPVGTGADTLVLSLSEDAYKGDARFQLTVDGKPVGPVQSVTALHGKGQSEAFTFKGDWSGAHTFGVTFTNDAWGGSAGVDRNLYVEGATLDGTQVEGAAALYGNGIVTFGTVPGQPSQAGTASQAGAAPAGMGSSGGTMPSGTGSGTAAVGTTPGVASSGGSSTPALVGTGADTLVLELSETAAQGDAQFTLTVDGKPVGAAQSVIAAYGQGQTEAFTFKGDWGAGPHTVGVSFANPPAGSTADLARGLYLDSASFDGTLAESNMQVTGNGPVTFAVTPGVSPPAPADASGTAADMLAVTDSDGSSAAVPLIASGSHTDHPASTSTVQQAAGGGTDTITTSGSVKGEVLTLGAGTRKLVLVNPRAMVLTGGSGADTVTADSGANEFVAGTGSLDVTGGPGAAAYVLHAGSGPLTVEPRKSLSDFAGFDPSKGDTLAVDKSLGGALAQAPDGHGGTLLTFGANQGSIDLINHASVGPSAIRFI